MAQIEEQVLEEIRQKADIVDVVNQYVTLRRSGSNYKGLCPFHGEKTPSFMVSPDKGIYKCFGCGAGGNVFTFLMNYHSQNFGEVVRELGRQVGVIVKYSESENSESEQWRVSLRRINQEANLFFQAQLKDPELGAEAREYLQQRGIEEYYQQRFQLGYAPQSWEALLNHLRKQGFELEQLQRSGLFKNSERSGKLYDFFRHRIMFPILSVNGDTLAFGGRTLDPDVGAKYINSPETDIYHKGSQIYALNLAKQAIRKKDRAILAEGYLDVITAHQFGFDETVAALGTALTAGQARQLLRFSESKRIYMAYDADPAGQKATDRGAEILEQVTQGSPLRLQVIQIPDREDPDTFLHKHGAEAFEQVLQEARPFTAYYLDKVLAQSSENPVDKSMAVHAAVKILLKIQDPVLQDEYIRYVADALKLEEQAVRDQIQQSHRQFKAKQRKQSKWKKREGSNYSPEQAPRPPEPLPLKNRNFISELGLLHLLMTFPEQRDRALETVQEMQFDDESNEELRLYLIAMFQGGLNPTWQELFSAFEESAMHQRLAEMMENPSFHALDFEKSLADFSRNVKLKCLGQELKRLSAEIQRAEQAPDRHAYQDLMRQYMELTQNYARLKQGST